MNESNNSRPLFPHRFVWSNDSISRFWNGLADVSEYCGQYFSRDAGEAVLSVCSAFVPLQGSVLDYGSGPGCLVDFLLRRGLSCVAYDWSSEAVRSLNERFAGRPGWEGAFTPQHGKMPFSDSRFDIIFCLETLEHVLPSALPDILSDLCRVLKPQGMLFLSVPNAEDLSRNTAMCPECGCVFHRHQHVRTFTSAELRCLVEQAGFRTVFCDVLPLWSFKNEGFPSLADLSIRRLGKQILLSLSAAADRLGLQRTNPRRLLIRLLRGKGDNLIWLGQKYV